MSAVAGDKQPSPQSVTQERVTLTGTEMHFSYTLAHTHAHTYTYTEKNYTIQFRKVSIMS